MKNWTVRQRIVFSFAAVLLTVVLMGSVAYWRLVGIERETTAMEHDSIPGLRASTRLSNKLWENYSNTQEHVSQSDKAELQKLELELRANTAQADQIITAYEPTITDSRNRELFEAFKAAWVAYPPIQRDVLRLSANGQKDEAHTVLIERLRPHFDTLIAALQRVTAYNDGNVDQQTIHIHEAIRSAGLGMGIVFVVAIVLAAISGLTLLRAITQPLARLVDMADVMRQGDFTQRANLARNDEFGTLSRGFDRMADELTALVGQVQQSSTHVNTSVHEIAATAKQQQATASEIAATTTEIGATSKEITATSKELSKTMSEVAAVAEQSATLAGSGQAGLSRMEETMRQVMDAAGSINAKLAVLNEKAGNINQVVTTITKVADQTNLLSLNAAIEAEKAGEYGRGFAVVATEIRRLADQTAVATYDIEQMVKEIQSAVSAGVMGMDKFSEEVRRGVQEMHQVGGQLSQIIQHVQTLAPRVETVNEGMEAQATGAEQISQALSQLSKAAQQTVESLRQSTLAIDGLNQVSTALRGGIARFKLKS